MDRRQLKKAKFGTGHTEAPVLMVSGTGRAEAPYQAPVLMVSHPGHTEAPYQAPVLMVSGTGHPEAPYQAPVLVVSGTGHPEAPYQAPVLMVSTSPDNEPTACQEVVVVGQDGMFQTDVAVSNDFSAWSVALRLSGMR